MQNRTLGTDLSVSAVGLGCMGFSHGYGLPTEAGETVTLLCAGRWTWGTPSLTPPRSTAPRRTPHANETLVGQALAPVRDRVVLSTKFGLTFDFTSGKTPSAHRAGLPAGDHPPVGRWRSLRRLGTDHIDLYYQHRIDPAVAPEEVAEGWPTSSGRGRSPTGESPRPARTTCAGPTRCVR